MLQLMFKEVHHGRAAIGNVSKGTAIVVCMCEGNYARPKSQSSRATLL
jgi:hypothetical protein